MLDLTVKGESMAVIEVSCYLTVSLFFILNLIATGGECQEVDFQYDNDTELCIGQSVEYQCIVTGTGFYGLTWRILDDNGTQIGSQTYVSTNLPNDTVTIGGGVFTVEQLSQSPLISNISFTVQSSINGYTIVCEDASNAMNNDEFIIQIPAGPPLAPYNVTVYPITFTKSSVNIYWTELSFSQWMCFTVYRYNVSSDTPDWFNVITKYNKVASVITLDGRVPSDDLYCVVLTAIDTGSSYRDPACFIFNVPPELDIMNVTNAIATNLIANITVTWSMNYRDVPSGIAVPPILSYSVKIFNTFDDSDEVSDSVDNLPPSTTSHTFTGVPRIDNYTIEVIVFNVVGSSSAMSFFTDAGVLDVVPSTAIIILPSSSIITSPAPSNPTTDTNQPLPPPVIIGIVVTIVVLIAAIAAVSILCCYNNKHNKLAAAPPKEDIDMQRLIT